MKSRTTATRPHAKLARMLLFTALAIGAGSFIHTASAAKRELPPVSPEGLKLVPKTKASAVYLRDGVNFGKYDKVAILDCFVEFRKDWKRDQNSGGNRFKVSEQDVTRIKTELAEEFKKVFAKQLADKGQTVVTTAGSGVLILRPAIINLDVEAPDTMEPGARTFSTSAGQATIYLELFDGVTSELLARVIDAESAGDFGHVGVRNSVTNRSDAQRMLKKWADALGAYLQNARESAPGSVPVAAPAKAPAAK